MNLDDAIVLETFSSRIEAEMAAGLLESEGVPAMVLADDAGGACLCDVGWALPTTFLKAGARHAVPGGEIMPSRAHDWLNQALRDLEQAQDSQKAGRHEWACFAAQQAAEKAVKALHLHLGQEAWGHVIAKLLQNCRKRYGCRPI